MPHLDYCFSPFHWGNSTHSYQVWFLLGLFFKVSWCHCYQFWWRDCFSLPQLDQALTDTFLPPPRERDLTVPLVAFFLKLNRSGSIGPNSPRLELRKINLFEFFHLFEASPLKAELRSHFIERHSSASGKRLVALGHFWGVNRMCSDQAVVTLVLQFLSYYISCTDLVPSCLKSDVLNAIFEKPCHSTINSLHSKTQNQTPCIKEHIFLINV